ncbi:MAG: hypothetical protein K2X38_12925 [Gemmataceae bacterium]|nr:hypothetical protein [Gemmataceae bacterium]
MPRNPVSFRLSDAVVEAIDDLAASPGDKTRAVSEALLYWRTALEQAGRRNADEFSPEDWELLGHLGDPEDNLIGLDDDEEARAPHWPTILAVSLSQIHNGRAVILDSHKVEQAAARKLAKKIGALDVSRGYALYSALRYFWRSPDAGIEEAKNPELWLSAEAKS